MIQVIFHYENNNNSNEKKGERENTSAKAPDNCKRIEKFIQSK